MMKQRDRDTSFTKHPFLFKVKAIDIFDSENWNYAFDSFWYELKNPNIVKGDLIYNFAVNFNFGSELFNPQRDFYSINSTEVIWNKGMRVRLDKNLIFIEKDNFKRRYTEIDNFINMLNIFKEKAVELGMNQISFEKTISKNIFNFAKEYSNEFIDYFHAKTNNIFYYEFEERTFKGEIKYVNRVWCRADIIRGQELCTVSPLRFSLGKEY